ncbi:MAG: segregation and condensation protein A [Brevinema sp.]
MLLNSTLGSYHLQLKNFEGPLDLLDELIGNSKLDITEIALAQITEQYLSYLKAMQEFNIDLASEFFVIAATLIYSKTRRLLPKIVSDSDEELLDEQDLLRRLKEYRLYRLLARNMEEKLDKGTVYFTRGRFFQEKKEQTDIEELTIGDLFRVIIRYRGAFRNKTIPLKRRFISVEQKMERLSQLLYLKSQMTCSEIMADESQKPDKIATFLGIADMTYHQKTSVIQNYLFEDFQVIKKSTD